jgi:hypothetical protein
MHIIAKRILCDFASLVNSDVNLLQIQTNLSLTDQVSSTVATLHRGIKYLSF